MEILAQTALVIMSVYGTLIAACYTGSVIATRKPKTATPLDRLRHLPDRARLSAAPLA